MASIPYLNVAQGLSESRKVVIASRAAALALAAVAIALLGMFEVETRGGGLSAPIVSAFIAEPARTPPVVVERPRATVAEAPVAASTLSEGDLEWPHLWTYDAQGRIVFRTNEQLVRCTNARRDGEGQADCPSSFDRTPMISSER